MASCKECLYYEVCPLGLAVKGKTGTCLKFKNKADFVEVVRCKDCKYWETKNGGYCRASNALAMVNNENNDFCSYGKRRDAECQEKQDQV